MKCTSRFAVALLLLTHGLVATAQAEDPHEARLRDSIARGLTIVQRGAANYPTHRGCFSCHHQTLPLLATMTAAGDDGKFDKELVASQLKFTQVSFRKRLPALLRGERTDGGAITVAYGLWTYEIAQAPADDLTDGMVANLIAVQGADGHWKPQSIRPPLAESLVSCTVLSAYGLQQFASPERKDAAQRAIDKAQEWLQTAPLVGNEDYVFHLWNAVWFDRPRAELDRARQALLALQRPDGGWAQLPKMDSDAYATGQALYVLQEAGVPRDARALERGLDYLLRTQAADGSWHVVTRARPVQVYFDNGDPYGKDQFISVSATSWAVAALARRPE